MSLFDVTPVYVQPGGVTPSQPGGSLTPNYILPDGTVIPSQPAAASWWQRLFGGDAPVYVPAPPPPSDPRGCHDDDGGVIGKGQGEVTTSRRRPRAATVTPSPLGTTPTE